MSEAFEKYAKFGKTEKQVAEMKGNLRIETRNIQKMMKENGVLDAKYSSNLLDNDISNNSVPLFWQYEFLGDSFFMLFKCE